MDPWRLSGTLLLTVLMNKRTRRTLWIVASVLVLLAVAIFLRSKAPPEAARLLPESDGILYANLRPFRAFLHQDKALKPPQRDPDYQQFVSATGIDWEQDLDEAAIALHRMPDPSGPNGPVAYSIVLVGRLKGKALASYLDAHGATHESYASHIIYNLPSEGRTVRVAQIGYDMVAISNTPTAEQIHSMLDRHRAAALPFSGSTLLAHHFDEVPLLSLAWGVGQIGLPFSESGSIHILGLALPVPSDTTLVASVRWAGSLYLRVEEATPDESTAQSQATQLNTLVTLARGVTSLLQQNATANGRANAGLKQILDSAEITQKRSRVVATATLNPSLLRDMTNEDTAATPTPSLTK